MKAVLCETFGPPESLVVGELVEPSAGPGEIVVDVAFVGLNFFDTLIIENKYQTKPALPFSPGGEFSGHVCALGEGAQGFAIGERVAGFCGHGAARGKVVIGPEQLVRVPDALGLEKAAGLCVTYGTSYYALRQRALLQPGETLAVLGASGGVGLAAVEIGRHMGARVIACASSPEKLAFARDAGAVETIDYAQSDLKEELKRLTEGKGVDVIYDPVGGALTEAAVRALGWQGRLLVVGFAAGTIPKLPLNLLLLKGCDARGVFWGDFVRRQPQDHQANMADICAWTENGFLSAHIHAIYPIDRVADALGVLTRREALGKVLLKM